MTKWTGWSGGMAIGLVFVVIVVVIVIQDQLDGTLMAEVPALTAHEIFPLLIHFTWFDLMSPQQHDSKKVVQRGQNPLKHNEYFSFAQEGQTLV